MLTESKDRSVWEEVSPESQKIEDPVETVGTVILCAPEAPPEVLRVGGTQMMIPVLPKV